MGAAAGPNVVEDGLVLALDAGNTQSYPGSGTTWSDLSDSGNDGTLTNGPTFSSADGGAFEFDGTNDYVSFSSSQNIGNEITISIWTNPTLNSTINALLSTKGSASSSGYALFVNEYNTNNKRLRFEIGNGSSHAWLHSATNIVSDGAWQNLVATCVRSTGSAILYKNSSIIANANLLVTDWGNSGTFEIGRFPNTNFEYDGKISLVQVYNRVLTTAEVTQNYNATKGRYGY